MKEFKPQVALGNLAILSALWLGNTHQDYLNRGWLVSAIKTMAIAAGMVTIIGRHQRHALQVRDYVDGLRSLVDDAKEVLYEVVPVAEMEAEVKRIAVEKFGLMPKLDTDPSFEHLELLPIRSYLIYAGKGKGKSQLFIYLCRRLAIAGAEVKIGDIHLPKTRADYGEYYPGIEESKYVVSDVRRIYAMYKDAERELDHRLKTWGAEEQKTGRPYIPAVEEFNTFIFSPHLQDKEREEIVNIITRIEDEGRWYKMFNLITTKSLKAKRTGIDSTVFSQMDWLVLQGGFDDPNTRFLEGIDFKAVSQRQKDMGGFTVAWYDANDSTVSLFKLPDNAVVGEWLKTQSERLIFEEKGELTVADYFEQQRDRITTLLRDNPKVSKTAIAKSLEGFGARSADNPKWVALDEFLDDVRIQIAVAQEDDVQSTEEIAA